MALSLLSQQQQQPSLFDLQSWFDPQPVQQYQYFQTNCDNQQQQHQQQEPQQQECHHQIHRQQLQRALMLKAYKKSCNTFTAQMEYTTSTQQSQFQQSNNNNNSSRVICTNIDTLTNNNSNNTNASTNTNPINSNSTFINGYTHQHLASDYVINFVDSPPNSEGSWTDEHSKESPGPQIIDVQTIYSNSGSRKRRMDWDSLDISQNGNPATTQSRELAIKTPHQERDKQKREKTSDNKPIKSLNATLEHFMESKAITRWRNLNGCRTAKIMLAQYGRKQTSFIQALTRSECRTITGVLTGHCLLAEHAHRLGLATDDSCRICKHPDTTETLTHVLCDCPALMALTGYPWRTGVF